jgi:peptidoglycan/LPS O-acetylase OafA/YrhL
LYLSGLIAVGFGSLLLTGFGIIPKTGVITSYQNPLNWILFFCIGILFRKFGLVSKMLERKKYYFLSIGGFAIFFVVGILVKCDSYWHIFALPLELSFLMTSIYLSYRVRDSGVLRYLGRITYAVYFLHMQIGIGIVNSLFQLVDDGRNGIVILDLLRPLAVITVTSVVVFAMIKITDAIYLNRYRWILGI